MSRRRVPIAIQRRVRQQACYLMFLEIKARKKIMFFPEALQSASRFFSGFVFLISSCVNK
jgi:hypothetical protein